MTQEGLKLKYFVLNPGSRDPDHGYASRIALRAYAYAIENVNPELAGEIIDWILTLAEEKVSISTHAGRP